MRKVIYFLAFMLFVSNVFAGVNCTNGYDPADVNYIGNINIDSNDAPEGSVLTIKDDYGNVVVQSNASIDASGGYDFILEVQDDCTNMTSDNAVVGDEQIHFYLGDVLILTTDAPPFSLAAFPMPPVEVSLNISYNDTTPPVGPSSITATEVALDNESTISLNFTAATDDIWTNLTYLIFSSADSGVSLSDTLVTTFTSAFSTWMIYNISYAPRGQTYYYTIYANDTSGNLGSRATPGSVVLSDLVPAQVLGLSISSDNNTINLSWSQVTTHNNSAAIGSDLAGYNIYSNASGSWTLIAQTSSTAYNNGSLTNGVEYFFMVSAYDIDGNEGQNSSIISAVPSAQPAVGFKADGNLIVDGEVLQSASLINVTFISPTLWNTTVMVYNATSGLVFNDTLNASSGETEISVIIDTTGYDEGNYLIYTWANDSNSNTVQENLSFMIDDTSPAINSIVVNDSDSNVTSTQQITVMVNITDASAVASVTLNGSLMAHTGDLYTLSMNMSSFGFSSDGLKSMQIIAMDAAGNINNTSYLKLRIDDTVPAVYYALSDDADSYVSGSQQINITVNASDNLMLQEVTADGTIMTNNNGVWYLYTTLAALGHVSDGEVNITITAADIVGNTNQATLTMVLDNTVPAVSGSDSSDADNIVLGSDIVNITVTVVDANISTVYINGTSMSQSGTSWWVMNTTTNLGCAASGPCTFMFTATDIVGNVNNTHTLTMIVDSQSPAVTSPVLSDSLLRSGDHVNISVTATDALSSVQGVSVNGTSMNHSGAVWYVYETPSNLGCPSGDGVVCNLVFNATDILGNSNDTVSVNLTIDDTAPVVSSYGYNSSTVGLNRQITLWADVTDTVGIFNVSVRYGSNDYITLTPSGSNYSVSTTPAALGITSTGNHPVMIYAYDNASNLDISKNITISVDSSMPVVTSGNVNATVVTSATSVVFSVFANDTSLVSVELNGSNMSGNLLSGGNFTLSTTPAALGCSGIEGSCLFVVSAEDYVGNINSSETITLGVDDIAPRVSGFSITDSTVRSGQQVTISVNATDSNIASVTVGGKALILQDGLYSRTDNVSSLGCAGDSACTLTLVASDLAGNINDSEQITIVVDDTAPAVSLTPANGSLVNSFVPNLAYNFTDDLSATASCILSINSVNYARTANNATDYVVPVVGASLLSGTDYTWSVSCLDLSGNTGTKQYTVSIDAVQPVSSISFNESANSEGWYSSPVLVNITGTDSSGINLTQWKNASNGTWIDVTAPFIVQSDLQDDIIYYRTKDNAGNIGTTRTQVFRYDDTAPVIGSIVPSTTVVSGSSAFTIDVYVSDAVSGVDSVTYVFNSSTGSLAYSSGRYTGTITAPASDGTYTLEVSATDTAGNTVTDSSVSIVVNSSLPTISVDYPDGARVANNTDITVTFANIDNAWYNTSANATLINVSSSVSISLSGSGTFSLNIWANNSAATVSRNYTYTIDSTAPAVSFSVPSVNMSRINGSLLIQASASDASGIRSVALSINDAANTTLATDTSAPYTFGLTTTDYDDGLYMLTLLATDNLGLTNTSVIWVNITNNIPVTVSTTGDPAQSAAIVEDFDGTPAETILDSVIGLNSTDVVVEVLDLDNVSVKPASTQIENPIGQINITADTAGTSRVYVNVLKSRLAALGMSGPYSDLVFYADHGAGIVGPLASGYVDTVVIDGLDYERFYFETDDYSVFFWGEAPDTSSSQPISRGNGGSSSTSTISSVFKVTLGSIETVLDVTTKNKIEFTLDSGQYDIIFDSIDKERAVLVISGVGTFGIRPENPQIFDLDDDGVYDLELNYISYESGTLTIGMRALGMDEPEPVPLPVVKEDDIISVPDDDIKDASSDVPEDTVQITGELVKETSDADTSSDDKEVYDESGKSKGIPLFVYLGILLVVVLGIVIYMTSAQKR